MVEYVIFKRRESKPFSSARTTRRDVMDVERIRAARVLRVRVQIPDHDIGARNLSTRREAAEQKLSPPASASVRQQPAARSSPVLGSCQWR